MSILKSLSLPRIKSSQISNPPEDDRKDASFKFKKIKLADVQQQSIPVGIPPLKQRTGRSHSVAAGLSVDQRKGLKTQRVNINLAEKKMRDGTYDEQEEVSSNLSELKRSCSEYTVETTSTNLEIEKLHKSIENIKSQIAVYNNDTESVARNIQEKKQKYTHVKSKVDDAVFDKSRLLMMIKDRKIDNLTLLGRVEQSRYELDRLKKHLQIILRSEIQAKDRDNQYENKYKSTILEYQTESKQIHKRLEQEQHKFQRFAENEMERDDRKRKMITISTSVMQEENQRLLRQNYNSFLANKMFNRFMEDKMNRLMDNNEKIQYLFRKVTQSYGPFTAAQFPNRFLNQQPEKESITIQVKQQQTYQTKLQQKKKILKKLSADLDIEYLALGEQIDNKNIDSKSVTTDLTEKSIEADEKLKIIGLWSQRNIKLLEEMLLSKKDRTQNIKNLTSFERLSKILDYTRQVIAKQSEP